MILPLRARRSPIGIGVDERSFVAAQLAARPAGWRLEAAVRVPRAVPGEQIDPRDVQRLRVLLASQGFTGRRVVLEVPDPALLSGVLELPPRSSGAPVEDIARAELARMHGYDPAAAEVACWDLPARGPARESAQVMAVACRHADADALLDLFEAHGMDVKALDSHLHALARACRPVLGAEGCTAILDMGWNRAVLGLLHRGRTVCRRVIAEGAVRALHQALATRLGVEAESIDYLLGEVSLAGGGADDPARADSLDALTACIRSHLEAVTAELRVTFSYAAHQCPGEPVRCMLLTGLGAGIPHLAEYLGSKLEVSARTVAPADVAQCPPAVAATCGDPSLTVAVGLAQFPWRGVK